MAFSSLTSRQSPATAPESALAAQLAEARRIIRSTGARPPRPPDRTVVSADFERNRWFPMPDEGRVRSERFRSDRRHVLSP